MVIISESESKDLDKYWKFYINYEGYLIFETDSLLIKSRDSIIRHNKWIYVEFHPASGKMYVGDTRSFRQEISTIIISKLTHITPEYNRLLIAPNSSVTLDELMVYSRDIDFSSYFGDTWGSAASLRN
jgi:hypothetical protein